MSHKKGLELELELEPMTLSEPTQGTGTGLFSSDSIALMSAKLHISENLLRLSTKDCKFSDFSRETLIVALQAVKSEAASILELDHGKEHFFFRAVIGTSSDRVVNFTVPRGNGFVGHVAESRQPLIVTEAEGNGTHLKSIDAAVGFRTRNVLAVPIFVRGELYGVMELLNRVGEASYTQQDLEIISYWAEMVSKVLEFRFMMAWAMKHSKGSFQKGEAA